MKKIVSKDGMVYPLIFYLWYIKLKKETHPFLMKQQENEVKKSFSMI